MINMTEMSVAKAWDYAIGLIGLRGCIRYFQDIHTWYMHDIDKGNDVLPERYGVAWVYTRYRLRVFHKLDYTEPATLTTWMEPYRQPVLVKQNLRIHQHGALAAQGKLESVVSTSSGSGP